MKFSLALSFCLRFRCFVKFSMFQRNTVKWTEKWNLLVRTRHADMISVRKKWANGIGNKSRALGYTNISETMFTQQAHKNLIKILTARAETPCRLSQTAQITKHQERKKLELSTWILGLFFHEIGAKTTLSERLITKSVARIGCLALAFNCKVKFNLTRRGHKCAEADGRQLLFLWDQLNCENGYYEITQLHSFREKRVAFEAFPFRTSSPPVVITRTLKQNPFLKDCFQNKAPRSNYSDSHVIIWRASINTKTGISVFLRILEKLFVKLCDSAMENLKYPVLEAQKNNFLITSPSTKDRPWYTLFFWALISSVIVFPAINTSLELIDLIFLEENVAKPEITIVKGSLRKTLWKSH